MKTLIILPTYNEIQNIPKLIENIFHLENSVDILVIDDNSPDGTGKLVDKIAKNNNQVKIIHRAGKLGLGSAYIAGFKYAIKNNYDLIFEMDADFSHDPKYIKNFINASKKMDLVIGSRWIKGGKVIGWPWYRFLTSWGANFATRILLGLKIKDVTSGYRCYHCKILKNLNFKEIISTGYAFQEEMIYRTQKDGFSIGEIPITFVDRKIGKSKMGSKEIISSAKAILKLAFNRN